MSEFASEETKTEHCAAAAPLRWPVLTSDIDVDVCVVGGGLAGLTAALTLAQSGRSVALLEARKIGAGASACNTGIVLPGYAESLDRIVERIGLPSAKALWSLSIEGVQSIRDHLSADATHDPGHLAIQRRDAPAKLRARAEWLRETFGAEVEFCSAEEVRAALPSPAFFQAMRFPAALNIVPEKYLRDLADTAERAGVRIFENTPAIGVDAEGVRKRVDTATARVRAGDIVLTAGAHLGSVMPRAARASLVLEVGLVETVPLPEQAQTAIRFRGSVGETGSYHRFAGGKLQWSGGATTRNTNTQALARRLRADIGQTYPLLRQIEIESAASATVATTVHRMPQIGELVPGVWLGAGFGRRGLATAAMAGLLIARAITVGDDRWRLFAPFGLVSSGGRTGRALAEAALKARRAAAHLQSFIARYRAPLPQHVMPSPTVVLAPDADDRQIVLEAERRWLDSAATPPAEVAPLVTEVAAEPTTVEAAPEAPKRKKKAPASRKRAPRAKAPPPADVIAVSRKPSRKRAAPNAATMAAAKAAPNRRRTATKVPPAEAEAALPPAPPERLN